MNAPAIQRPAATVALDWAMHKSGRTDSGTVQVASPATEAQFLRTVLDHFAQLTTKDDNRE